MPDFYELVGPTYGVHSPIGCQKHHIGGVKPRDERVRTLVAVERKVGKVHVARHSRKGVHPREDHPIDNWGRV